MMLADYGCGWYVIPFQKMVRDMFCKISHLKDFVSDARSPPIKNDVGKVWGGMLDKSQL